MPINRNQATATANAAPSATSIALSQTLGGAALVTLNGALAAAGPPPFTDAPAGASPGPVIATLPSAQPIAIASAGNDSGITFTINGTDYGGSAISEVLTGGNIATVTSVNQYKTITSIKSSGATAAAITVGQQATMYSPWLILGAQRNNYTTRLRAFPGLPDFVGGTGTFVIQGTSDPKIMLRTGGQADDIETVQVSGSTGVDVLLASPLMAVRLQVTAGSATLRAIESRTA